MEGGPLAARIRAEVAEEVRELGELSLATVQVGEDDACQLYLGRPTLVPATPLGIMALLAEHRIALEGARAVVIGRSDIVGKPIALLLLGANATVTICHSRTADLARHTLDADILVVAVGQAGVIGPDMVKTGSAVVDVGMNRTEAGLVGDVPPRAAERAPLP